ncbi:MAG: hypothetical protein V4692_01455, partial [Bdellovibrionota bacterium]
MKQWWGLYFLIVGLTLSVLAAFSLTVLYNWKVEPVLKRDRAVHDKHIQLYQDDLDYLNQFDVFKALAPQKGDLRDASGILNPAYTWLPRPTEEVKVERVDPDLIERLIRMESEWITLAGKQKVTAKYQFPFLGQVAGFDIW